MSEFFRKIRLKNGYEVSVPTDSFGIFLDPKYIVKRQNRTIMAEKKQPRDAHGHFASKDVAKKKKSNKKTLEKTYRDAFLEDEKIIKEQDGELQRLNEENFNLKSNLADTKEENDTMKDEIENLRDIISELKKDVKHYEGKAKRYFDTIEAQNDLLREVDSNQLTWYRNHASWWTRLRHFKRIVKMMNVVCTLRQEVLNTMYKW